MSELNIVILEFIEELARSKEEKREAEIEQLKRKANALDFLANHYHHISEKNDKHTVEVYGLVYEGDTLLEAVEQAMESNDE